VAAGLFLRAFHTVLAEGHVVRANVLALMYVGRSTYMSVRTLASHQETLSLITITLNRSFHSSGSPIHQQRRRVWRTWSVAAGADVTWGVFDKMAGVLQIRPGELEAGGPAALALELPEAERCVRACVMLMLRQTDWVCINMPFHFRPFHFTHSFNPIHPSIHFKSINPIRRRRAQQVMAGIRALEGQTPPELQAPRAGA
jgi:hypothetical protein